MVQLPPEANHNSEDIRGRVYASPLRPSNQHRATTDGQSVQSLCDRHPEMTRFGVMKHLAVLEGANLVVVRKEGRVKRHFLNPIPIQQISDRWIDKYARPFTRAMTDLQRRLESREGSS